MDDNNSYTHSIPRGFYKQLAWFGLPVKKAFIILLVFVGSLQANNTVFPKGQGLQFFLFFVLTNILAIYLMLPTRAGFSNAHAIFMGHFRKKRYISIERNDYPVFEGTPKEMLPTKMIGAK